MTNTQMVEIPVSGMDCLECTKHVQQAVEGLRGVQSVTVLLASEKAIVRFDPSYLDLSQIQKAIGEAGYSVPVHGKSSDEQSITTFSRRLVTLLAVVFGAIVFIVVIGEWLGLFEKITRRVPFTVGLIAVILGGWPIFKNVARATLKLQIISHTLMTMGMIAALLIGEWATAAVIVFFMRVGDYAEGVTTEGARRAVKDLAAMSPQNARIERNGVELEIPVSQVTPGDAIIVRPGEKIPVDGDVISGQATIDQSAITGESMPVEVSSGSQVFAATILRLGSLRIKATRVGLDTTFGRVIKMVQEAEANRSNVQRFADRFSGYFFPIVAGFAALTFLIRHDPMATAAVLVVACSCSIALATPIAMLASIGASAKRGLLIKGGKYLESLARADVVLIDKTGTLTLGKPRITDVIPLTDLSSSDLLCLAASAERYSEHPLAEAVRGAARAEGLSLHTPENFEAVPGLGVLADIAGSKIVIGNQRMVPSAASLPIAAELEKHGKTLLFVSRNGELVGVLAAADELRSEVPGALDALRDLGVRHMELLTGDNEQTATALARELGVQCQANLLPEDKIRIVKSYQAKGHTVVMIGDGINDAPALAQADIGIAMGAAGADIAIEAAHIALMRQDWGLVPEVFRIARRTMGTVKMNLAFTAIYNVVGLALAALGFLPPVVAAAAQSLPDLGILGNSARLLRQG